MPNTLKVVACETDIDLRRLSAKRSVLRHIAAVYKLKNNDAVCFTNVKMTRFRLISKINDVILLCVPETDNAGEHHVYLHVSREFQVLTGLETAKVEFERAIIKASERIDRQKTRKKLLQQREQEHASHKVS